VPLYHSLRAPTVGYRIGGTRQVLFYAPDVAALIDPDATLRGIDLYIGDGSALDTSLLRQEQGQPCGHAPVQEQLQWCHQAGIRHMIISHCGEQIIADEAAAIRLLRALAESLQIQLSIACDGQKLRLY
jgi:hypothetical protein